MKNVFTTTMVKFCLILNVLLFIFISGPYADERGHGEHLHDAHSVKAQSPADSGISISMTSKPVNLRAGEAATLRFSVKDGEGRPARGVSVSHDRILHVIIISEDLSLFAHVHPEDFGLVTKEMVRSAQFGVRYDFPKAGRYLVAADTAVNGTHISNQFMVEASGDNVMGAPRKDLSREKKFGEYDVTFSSAPEQITAKKETVLRYEIKENGKPVTDLETYLAAPMHIAVVLTDLGNFIHAHGSSPGAHTVHQPVGHIHGTADSGLGPVIEAKVVFPVKGMYRIFSEVKHRGRVLLLDFMVDAE